MAISLTSLPSLLSKQNARRHNTGLVFFMSAQQQRATISTGTWPNGVYSVEMVHGTKIYADKVLISRR